MTHSKDDRKTRGKRGESGKKGTWLPRREHTRDRLGEKELRRPPHRELKKELKIEESATKKVLRTTGVFDGLIKTRVVYRAQAEP